MLNNADWREIEDFVSRLLAQSGQSFIQGRVIKSDQARKLVWLKELGDQAIPVISFDFQVKYHYNEPYGDTTAVGAPVNSRVVVKKTTAYSREVEVLAPQPGEIVLVALQLGSHRLPKCIGVVKGSE